MTASDDLLLFLSISSMFFHPAKELCVLMYREKALDKSQYISIMQKPCLARLRPTSVGGIHRKGKGAC